MSTKRVIVWNVFWNWAGVANSMVAGFVVAPFLVRHLGETNYGLWILIASLTGYFGLLDLGVRGSVGRNIAFFRARNDRAGVNGILSTALALQTAAAAVALLAMVGILFLFFRLFQIPPAEVGAVRLALLLVGLNLALSLPLSVFDATLWGSQRFDLLNGVDIVTVLVRTGLTFYLVGNGGGLVTLAVLTMLGTVVNAGVKAGASFRIDRGLCLGRAFVTREHVRSIFTYGIWHFVLSVARVINTQIGAVIVGSVLSVPLVTPFSIATRLLGYATSILSASGGVLTPVATGLHANEKHGQQQRLFVEGGKYCLAMALFFVLAFLFLGKAFIGLWMGPGLASSAQLLAILTLGEAVPMSQWITYGMILGMGRHRMQACVNVAESLVAVSLALVLARPFGLLGVCLAFAIPAFVCRGVIQLLYACHTVKVSLGHYLVRAFLPALLSAVPPAGVLALLTAWRTPSSWAELLAYGTLYATAYGMAFVCLAGFERLNRLLPEKPRRWLSQRTRTAVVSVTQ
jgi:O-antigen/teichoic acid export membrane protein